MFRWVIGVLLLSASLMTAAEGWGKAMTLRMLIWEGYAPTTQVDAFKAHVKKTYGVDLTVNIKFADSTAEFYDGIVNKTTDIISPPSNFPKSERFPLIQKGYVLPINIKHIPNYANLIPALKKAEYISYNWQVYGVPIAHGPYGLAYNKKFFKTAPTSWSVLWDPKYANNYSISSDQYEANIYITALALGLTGPDLYDLHKVKTQRFKRRLTQLVANAKTKWVAVDTPKDLKGLALATSWGDSLGKLKALGEDWAFATPKEGTTGWLDNMLIGHSLKQNPELKRIAEEWLNWCLSDEYQINAIVRAMGNDPVSLSIKPKLTREEVLKHHVHAPEFFINNRILWPSLDMKTQNGFEFIWLSSQRKTPATQTK